MRELSNNQSNLIENKKTVKLLSILFCNAGLLLSVLALFDIGDIRVISPILCSLLGISVILHGYLNNLIRKKIKAIFYIVIGLSFIGLSIFNLISYLY